jgi:hypothetical protein
MCRAGMDVAERSGGVVAVRCELGLGDFGSEAYTTLSNLGRGSWVVYCSIQ